MRAIWWKEWREQRMLTMGVAALISLAFAVSVALTRYGVARAIQGRQSRIPHPLMDESFLLALVLIACGFGALLGWLQGLSERQKDIWAFLIHRPPSRDRILAAKLSAGLILYLGATLVPWVVAVLYVAWIARLPMPFDLGTVLPSLAILLAGIPFQATGMLLALRQPRWKGIRLLMFGIPLIGCAVAAAGTEFSHAAVAIAGATAITWTALWGCFRSDGSDEVQPEIGRLALAVCVTAGVGVIVALALVMAKSILPEILEDPDHRYIDQKMTRDGQLYEFTYSSRAGWKVRPFPGFTPTNDVSSVLNDHSRSRDLLAPVWTVGLQTESALASQYPYSRFDRFFRTQDLSDGEAVYYSAKSQAVLVYNLLSGDLVGNLSATGFDGAFPKSPGGLTTLKNRKLNSRGREFVSLGREAIYHIDLESRAVRLFFQAAAGEEVTDVTDYSDLRGEDYGYIVATRSRIYRLDKSGHSIWSFPLEPVHSAYQRIRLVTLEDGLALRFEPDESLNETRGRTAPQLLLFLDPEGKVRRSVSIPSSSSAPTHWWYLGLAWVTAPSPVSLWIAASHPQIWVRSYFYFLTGTVALSLLIAGAQTKRAGWKPMRFAAWSPFFLLLGLHGLLAFLCVHHWPKHKCCAQCGKSHPVSDAACPACGAAPPPKETDGTELFEPLEASAPATADSTP